ncbi:MAG: LD-carboxypeptidase [Nitrospirae bacterium]|nr:LD-carboxypeptidase [Nitrospirota bacterium]
MKQGDIIGVVSPSDPLLHYGELRTGLDYLRGLGFEVEAGRHICSEQVQERAEDINVFFARRDIKAIFSTQGGNSAEDVLRFCDMDVVRANPKVFMGLSDVTVFLNGIYHKTGVITYHGSNVRLGEQMEPSDYERGEFIDRLCLGNVGAIRPYKDRTTVRGGVGRGRLLGGNLRCLLKLADTEFWPDFTDAVLFIESYRITEESCLRYFGELKERGVFDKIRGCMVGFNYSMQVKHPEMSQMETLLLRFTSGYDFPILKVEDFGHFCPNTVLPVGSQVELNADTKEVRITEGG